ncbi:MAG: GNAT family N-acetyltransferase [Erysipelotrichales bacterium]
MLEFKEIEINDYEEFKLISEEILDKHIKNRPDIYKKGNPLSNEYFLFLLNDEDTISIKAVYDNKIVGISVIEIKDAPISPIVHEREFAFIDTFGVLKEYQGQGIGQRLFDKSIEYIKMMGINKVELLVWEFNEQAIKFYEKNTMNTLNRTLELII